MGEIVVTGLPAQRAVDGVVDVGSFRPVRASEESAALIPCAEEPFEGRVCSVSVDRHREAAVRVVHHAVPAGCAGGEFASDLGVDRAVAGEEGGLVALARRGEHRDRDLHFGTDRREHVALAVTGRRSGEDHVGEDVGAEFVQGSLILLRTGGDGG
nr:hypothetical protein [Microbacterium trichothecenolyticum]